MLTIALGVVIGLVIFTVLGEVLEDLVWGLLTLAVWAAVICLPIAACAFYILHHSR